VTLAADRRGDNGLHRPEPSPDHDAATGFVPDRRPVEFWPTSAIRAAMESGDLATWQRIATALKRDPYGRTARQVEEVLETASAYGISEALAEVLTLSRAQLEADERAEVARQVRALLDRSGLGHPEFASRIGVSAEMLTDYVQGAVSLPASQLVRMRRLADRFAKIRAQRSSRSE
jgi:DNA-binding transcriptional regulator YiaG